MSIARRRTLAALARRYFTRVKIDRAKSYDFAVVERELRRTKGYRGATGTITIDPKTGYRTTVPVSILRVDNQKRFVPTK